MSVLDLPAVHYKRLAGDEIRIRRAKKKGWASKVLRLLIPLDGSKSALSLNQLLRHASEYRFCQGQPWSHDIDCDPVVTYLHGE